MKKGSPIDVKNVLVVEKCTKYEREIEKHNVGDQELKKILKARGSNYKNMRSCHDHHKAEIDKIIHTLDSSCINYTIVRPFDMGNTHTDNIDLAISAGGDGTFLRMASKIPGDLPVFGINTDRDNSEGYFCSISADGLSDGLEQIIQGAYELKSRSRIKVTLYDGQRRSILDHYALNEVAIAEHDFSETSYYELSTDGGHFEKQKSSGVLVATGSGSTAWIYNEVKMYSPDVKLLFEIAGFGNEGVDYEAVTKKFNDLHIFDAESDQLEFFVRSPIVNKIFSAQQRKDFVSKIAIRSKGWEACIKIDSMSTYDFNDGRMVEMEIGDNVSLKSIHF